MTVEVNIMENGKGVEILAYGVVTGKEILKAYDKTYSKEFLSAQKYQLFDKSKCTKYAVTAEDIKSISELDKSASKANPNIIIAVIDPECLKYSLAQLWQTHVNKHIFKTKSFVNRDDALEWVTENQK